MRKWLNAQRAKYRKGELSEEKITLPDKLGMIWNASEGRFLAALEDCREYYAKHGNLQIPLNMVGKSGVRLNYWISDRIRNHFVQAVF